MIYNNTTRKEFADFLSKIDAFLQVSKKLKLKELNKMETFLKQEENVLGLKGMCTIRFHSRLTKQDIGNVTEAVTVIINNTGLLIKSFYQEDFYGEYYTNNTDTIGDEEPDEFLGDTLKSVYETIQRISDKPDCFVEFESNKFGIITKRINTNGRIKGEH